MKALFKKTDGDYLEATLEVNGVEIVAMDCFGGSDFTLGDELDIKLDVGLHYEDEAWESMFSDNPDGRRELVRMSGQRYRAYGVITEIDDEVLVDVGITKLDAPIRTSDPNVVGESIAFTIERLEASGS